VANVQSWENNSDSTPVVGSGNSIQLSSGSDSDDAGDNANIDIILNFQTVGNKNVLEGIGTVTFIAEAQ